MAPTARVGEVSLRKFRGVPRSGFKSDTTEQPFPAPAERVQEPHYRLAPVYGEDGVLQLYDVFKGDKWCGSRRTRNQCATVFLRDHSANYLIVVEAQTGIEPISPNLQSVA